MMRLLSASALIVLSLAVSFAIKNVLSKNLNALQMLVSDLNIIINTLRYETPEVGKLLASLASCGAYTELWSALETRVSAGDTLYEAWTREKEKLMLGAREKNEVDAFMLNFGKKDRKTEISKLELARQKLASMEACAAGEHEKRMKLASTLPLFLGLALALAIL